MRDMLVVLPVTVQVKGCSWCGVVVEDAMLESSYNCAAAVAGSRIRFPIRRFPRPASEGGQGKFCRVKIRRVTRTAVIEAF
jgi:hypothetical protein